MDMVATCRYRYRVESWFHGVLVGIGMMVWYAIAVRVHAIDPWFWVGAKNTCRLIVDS